MTVTEAHHFCQHTQQFGFACREVYRLCFGVVYMCVCGGKGYIVVNFVSSMLNALHQLQCHIHLYIKVYCQIIRMQIMHVMCDIFHSITWLSSEVYENW